MFLPWSKQSSSETHPADQPTSHESAAAAEEDDDEYAAGLTARQKTALGFVWFMSAMYAIMNDQVNDDDDVILPTLLCIILKGGQRRPIKKPC